MSRSIRLAVVYAVVGGCALAVAAAPSASARPAYSSLTIYYANASMTTVVGTFTTSCGGGRGTLWGHTSAFPEDGGSIPCR